ncbi:MAG: endolytic transglycosylase MltG [Actinomycetes bacterium]
MTAPTPTHGSTPRRRAHPVLVVVVLVGLIVGGAFVGIRLLGNVGVAEDYPGPGTGEVVIEVEPGDSSSAIGATLAEANVVASTEAFVDAALADDRAVGIQPGFFAMSKQMSADGALERLLDPAARVQIEVAIPEGLRVDETVNRLVRASKLPRRDFVQALATPKRLGLPAYAEGEAEGFLFPATYSFDPDASAEQMLTAMVARYQQAADEVGLVEGAATAGYTPREALTIASLVQAEVAVRDFGKASRVIANRLELGMTLGFDSTINYALGIDDLTLVNEQLAVDSPYNTYVNVGLPPGPINSPGEAAMAAAIAPPEGDWLYFVAVAPGSDETQFTADYQEFLQFKDEFYDQVP